MLITNEPRRTPLPPNADERTQGRASTRARRVRAVLLVLGILSTAIGVTLVSATALAPEVVAKVAGPTKVAVQKQVQQWVAPDDLPEITLGGEGEIRELDRCDGTFTEMVSYRVDDVLPLYAAHNNCGGDIILGWEIGQRVRVAGSDVVYEVVEERHTPKWSKVETLRGMTGQFMVQTCFYGESKMRFLSLSPVEAASRRVG